VREFRTVASAAVAVKLRLDQSCCFIFLCSLAGSLLQVGGVVAEVRRAAEWFGARCYVIDAGGRVRKNTWTMAQKLSDKRLAVLGAGKLGGILLRAYLKQGLFAAKHVTATVKHGEKSEGAGERAGRQRDERQPQSRERRGYYFAGREAASRRRLCSEKSRRS